jgi:tRNA modification GTPase
MTETIFALASAPGRAAVAVMRISGPEAGVILDLLCAHRPPPRKAALRAIRSPEGETIDHALVLWFPSPRSFTGEDVAEIQPHGGRAVLEALAESLRAFGARPALPGEFTRRAFESGRLDLSQAEAVADLVDAETDAQRRQALSQLEGAITRRVSEWRGILIEALGFLEAQIDFPDEDVPADVADQARAPLSGLLRDVQAVLAVRRGERVRTGLKIALIGPPNAGKSSLFNALLNRDAAIVTAIPGTTRDVVEATLSVEGHKVTIADTAGLRDATDVIEREGVRRALAWAHDADLRLHVRDLEDGATEYREALRPGDLMVFSKSDLQAPAGLMLRAGTGAGAGIGAVAASVVSADGVTALRAWLSAWVRNAMTGADAPAITQIRHRELFLTVQTHLQRALDRDGGDAELVAEDVRLAARCLDQISGRIGADDVLDRVFSSFCIGK